MAERLWTDFECWCLALAWPALALPALDNPTDAELLERARACSYDIFFSYDPQPEKALAQSAIRCGALDYLEDCHEQTTF